MGNRQELEQFFNKALDLKDEARQAYYESLSEDDASRVRIMVDDFEGMESSLDRGVLPLGVLAQLAGHANSSFLETTDDRGRIHPLVTETMPDWIGPYKVLGKIGEGGMGLVYLVEQQEPKRKLALKLLTQARMSAEMRARFEAEYQTQAMMRHPNIASMHETGVSDHGEVYFTMEYIKGWTITDYCVEKSLSLEDRLELFMQVCDGVTHAHQKSVMHRDLKPTNILVTEESGTAQVKIIDFGIAKLMETHEDRDYQTRVGALVGTLEYMSTEQLSGHGNIDTRSDVFSLGVVLYEMLCGQLPRRYRRHGNSSPEEVLRYYRETEAQPPSRHLVVGDDTHKILKEVGYEDISHVINALRRELDWVPLKAMAIDLDRRYQSPANLKADLKRFLDFEPVEARPPGMIYNLEKFIKRHALAVSLVLVIVLATLSGIALLLRSNQALSAANAETEKNLNKFEATNDFLQGMLSAPDPRNRGIEARVIDVMREAEKRLDTRPAETSEEKEIEASIRLTLGKTLYSLGQYADSGIHYEKAWELYRDALGEFHPKTLKTRFYMGRAYFGFTRIHEARDIFEDIYNLQLEMLGPDHPDTLESKFYLGTALSYLLQREEASEILEVVYSEMYGILGVDARQPYEAYYRYLVNCRYRGFVGSCYDELLDFKNHFGTKWGENDPVYLKIVAHLGEVVTKSESLQSLKICELSQFKSCDFVGFDVSYIIKDPEYRHLYNQFYDVNVNYSDLGKWYTDYSFNIGEYFNYCHFDISDLFQDKMGTFDYIDYGTSNLELVSWYSYFFEFCLLKKNYSSFDLVYLEHVAHSAENLLDKIEDKPTMSYYLKVSLAMFYWRVGKVSETKTLLCESFSSIDRAEDRYASKFDFYERAMEIHMPDLARMILEDIVSEKVFPHSNEAEYQLYKNFDYVYGP